MQYPRFTKNGNRSERTTHSRFAAPPAGDDISTTRKRPFENVEASEDISKKPFLTRHPPKARGPSILLGSAPFETHHCFEAFEGRHQNLTEFEVHENHALQKNRLEYYLPETICKQYAGKNKELFEWQSRCLSLPGILEGKNVVYCAPTSAGKSLVSEILMLRKIASTSKVAMLVLPFVALCTEKAKHLEVLLKPLGKHVRRFYGSETNPKLFLENTGVLVCTIEKANALINRIIEEERLSDLGIVVVDELHMINDPHRGYQLELMLTKLRYMSAVYEDSSTEVQIVGMSATMPNGDQVANWLDAKLYETDVRPVPLKRYLCKGKTIFDAKGEFVRDLEIPDSWEGEFDHAAWLTRETLDAGHSVLIFCCSRRACELCASHIAERIEIQPQNDRIRRLRESFVRELEHAVGEHQSQLASLISKGVAFHHSGLSSEERDLVERSYKAGSISVIAATSTLAAGVNLPARRVIFKEPYKGIPSNVLHATDYRQMAGRAGRTGIDEEGEAYLLESKHVKIETLQTLMQSDSEFVSSCLGKDQKGMVRLLLEGISIGAVKTGKDIERFIEHSLLSKLEDRAVLVSAATEALNWLQENKLITWNPKNYDRVGYWSSQDLSKAVVHSGIDPRECARVKTDLREALQNLNLASDLHLTYLVTPLDKLIETDWDQLYFLCNRLSQIDTSIAELVGVNMAFLLSKKQGDDCSRYKEEERIASRFYNALVLRDYVSEVPIATICKKYNLTLSNLEALQEQSCRYANMCASFCECLGWVYLKLILEEFRKRISGGTRPEIVFLTEIPFVKSHRARVLYKAGFTTVESIAKLDSVEKLAKALALRDQGNVNDKVNFQLAQRIVRGARALLTRKLSMIEEETKAAVEVLSVDDNFPLEDVEFYEELNEIGSHLEQNEMQASVEEQNPSEMEKELTTSLRRLSFDPSPFVNHEGIVVLKTEKEVRSLCRYLTTSNMSVLSFDSHLDLETGSLLGISVCWSETMVAYIEISDDLWKLWHFLEILESPLMQKWLFETRDHVVWISVLLQQSSHAFFPNLMDLSETAKAIRPHEPAMNHLAGLFQVFGLEEEFRMTKELFALASNQSENESSLLHFASNAALVFKLGKMLHSKLIESGMEEYCLQIKMSHVLVAERMARQGVHLDRTETIAHLTQIEDKISKLSDICAYFAKSADPLSNNDVEKILFDQFKLKKPNHGTSKNEDMVLRELQDLHPAPATFLCYRRFVHLRTCLSQTLDQSSDQRMVLRGDLFHQVFETWFEDEANLIKNLPLYDVERNGNAIYLSKFQWNDSKHMDFKKCLQIDDGHCLIEARYLHLELWLLLHFSQDPEMIEAISQNPNEPIKAIVGIMHKRPLNQIASDSVEYMERFLQSFFNGAGSILSAHLLGVSPNRAQSAYEGFRSVFEGVGDWMKQMVETWSQTHEVLTLYGQKLRIEGTDVARSGMRCLIKGSIADVIKYATLHIVWTLKEKFQNEYRLVYEHNGSFVIEVPESASEAASVLLNDALMAAADFRNVSIPVKVMVQRVR